MIKKFFMSPQHGMKQTYIWTVLAGVIYAGSSFIMQMTTSKCISVAQAGILSLALAVGNQLVTIGFYNIRTFQVSDVLEKYKFSDYCMLRVITVSAMLIAGIVWTIFGGYSTVKMAAIMAAVVFRAVEAVSDVLEGRYQQKGRYDISCKGVVIKDLAYLAAFLITLFITKSVFWGLCILAVVYLFMILVIDSQIIGEFGGISFKTSWKKQGALLIEGFPLFVNAFLNAYIINAPKYALEEYYTSEVLGIFTVLYMMAFVVNMFASFVLKPIISVLAEKYVKNDISGFLRLIFRQMLVIAAATAVCILGAYIAGVPVLSFLFGVDLAEYKGALCLILVSGGFTAMYQLYQYGIIIMRHQYSTFICCGLTVALTYVITPYLTRKYEIMGATISYTLSIGFMSILFISFFVFYLVKDRKKREEKYE